MLNPVTMAISELQLMITAFTCRQEVRKKRADSEKQVCTIICTSAIHVAFSST